MSENLDPLPPPNIPGYALLRRIGRGGYGEVWLARKGTDQYWAIKIVHRRSGPEGQRAYDREFGGMDTYLPVSKRHPGLVKAQKLERSEDNSYFYYVMELADDASGAGHRSPDSAQSPGSVVDEARQARRVNDPQTYEPHTLRVELDRRGRLPPAQCVDIGLALVEGLMQLHKFLLVHRDIKPSNIIFVDGRPKLADPGLVVDAEEQMSVVGTPGYMPPEGPGYSGDIYSFSRVLYEMSTGLRCQEFPRLPLLTGAGPEEKELVLVQLNAVFCRAGEEKVKDRYATVKELLAELRLLDDGKSVTRHRERKRFRRLGLVAGLIVVLALLVDAAVLLVRLQRQHAVETARQREVLLRTAQLIRARDRRDNWSSESWAHCVAAARLRLDDDVRIEAVKTLTGMDAHPVRLHRGRVGSSAAFAPDGRAVVGGWRSNRGTLFPGLLIHPDGALEELPVQGAGPVCWTGDGVPLQFIAATNACELREMTNGHLRWRFPLAAGDEVADNDCPVLAMAADGSFVAAAVARRLSNEQGEIYHGERVLVWDARTGRALPDIQTPASVLAFSPDGALLVVGRQDGGIELYELPAVRSVLALPPASQPIPVTCLALAPDWLMPYEARQRTNRWMLAAGYKGGQVALWDLDRRRVRRFYDGAAYAVVSLVFLQDGQTLATGGHVNVRLHDLVTGRLLLRMEGSGGDEIRALATDAGGARLLAGTINTGGSPNVGLWSLSPHRDIRALRGLRGGVRKLWFSTNQNLVAALSDNWHVAIWEAHSGRLRNIFEMPAGMYADNAGGAFDASGARFAFATQGESRLYDLATGRVLGRWELNDGLSDQLQFNASNQLLLVRREQAPLSPPGRRNWWRLYRLDPGGSVTKLLEQTNINFKTTETLFRLGGEHFVVWDVGSPWTRRTIEAYSVAAGTAVWRITTAALDLNQPAVHLEPTGQWLICNVDSSKSRWVVRMPEFTKAGDFPEGYAAISPSGEQFAVFEKDGVRILDRQRTSTGFLLSADSAGLGGPSFSPDGSMLAWGTDDGMVIVADLEKVRERLDGLR